MAREAGEKEKKKRESLSPSLCCRCTPYGGQEIMPRQGGELPSLCSPRSFRRRGCLLLLLPLPAGPCVLVRQRRRPATCRLGRCDPPLEISLVKLLILLLFLLLCASRPSSGRIRPGLIRLSRGHCSSCRRGGLAPGCCGGVGLAPGRCCRQLLPLAGHTVVELVHLPVPDACRLVHQVVHRGAAGGLAVQGTRAEGGRGRPPVCANKQQHHMLSI